MAGGSTVRSVLGDLFAGLLVLGCLLLPDRLSRSDLGSFAAVPIELVLGAVVLLILPHRVRRTAAAALGLVLGLLTLLKIVDAGFYAALARPYDLILDWWLVGGASQLLVASLGLGRSLLVAAGVALVLLGVPLLLAWAVSRLARLLGDHPGAGSATIAALTAFWLTCAATGAVLVAPYPVASHASTTKVIGEIDRVRAGLEDERAFAVEATQDAYREVPGTRLLSGLRGKQVVIIFVESYGRIALTHPAVAPEITGVLDRGTRRLSAAGLQVRSGYLTSPTAGGGSWLAHSTLLSGLWIDSQQRYRSLVSGDRLTLTRAFAAGDWRTVGVMPGMTSAWPEGAFYGYQDVLDSSELGYRGPAYGWAQVPDQFTLAVTARLLTAGAEDRPTMAVVPLITSHAPWTPVPTLVDPAQVGDGSALAPAAGPAEPPEAIGSRAVSRVRADYARSIGYSLDSVVAQVTADARDDLVVIMLGDHQPAPVVTGPDAGRDVPISVITADPSVLDRIEDWGWTPGLQPAADAPIWRMDEFRDRFLDAYSD